MSPYLIVLGAGAAIFALLLVLGAGGRRSLAGTTVAALASMNVVGIIGLGWFAAEMLIYDGVMVIELLMCAGLMAVLAAITAGGFTLERRGMTRAAIVLLAVAAVPTIVVFGFLLYLHANPIDWR